MALLRFSDGRVYCAAKDINPVIAPMTLGTFPVGEKTLERLAATKMPPSRDAATFFVEAIGPAQRQWLESEGFISWRVGSAFETGDSAFGAYHHFQNGDSGGRNFTGEQRPIPHTMEVDDIHFVFSGAVVKGFELENGLQGVIYVQAGEWLRVGPEVLCWPVLVSGQPTIAVSFYSKVATAQGGWKRNDQPSHKIDPAMRF